jgi:serine/threonine protein phosphatase PrpC
MFDDEEEDDDEFKEEKSTGDFIDIALSGTSATIVIQLQKKVYVAFVGDSNVLIGSREKK